MGSYVWYSGTLVDGRIRRRIPVSSSSWSVVLDDAGALQLDATLADPAVADLDLRNSAEPCRCFLAVAYADEQGEETFLQAGPVWSHSYDAAAKRLTIGAAGVLSYYDHRLVLPVLAANVSPASVTTTATGSLGTIAKRLVQLAHTHTGGALPIVFPADVAGTDSRDYPGNSPALIGQAIRDLANTDGGPEVQFVPRRNPADGRFLQWVMRIGTPTQPLLVQVGADWTWDAAVPKSSVNGISVARDGSSVATRVWQQGSGTDNAVLYGRADSTVLLGAGFPLLEVQGSGTETVTSQTQLNAQARGLQTKSAKPVETWTVRVRRDAAPNVAAYSLGDWARLNIAGDPYLPDGDYRMRVTGKSGDESTDVSLTLQSDPGGS